ncbi:hypothetical protein LL270_08930 [Pseudomonas aestusnigri]|uniref:hypothetical protein n=1 Tax=Halopseudomonas aestusnigri TaxID=857252 RepID=UPI001D18493D|nr:hypothetical protein [Halopseudomonas aestusnigri]MCC4260778.1 hypothetical protein [Halopseudomonas aestusnigri]
MTIYTDGLVVRPDRNVLDDVVTGQLDAAQAAFGQSWFENPAYALYRINEFNRAELGPVVSPAYPAYGIEERRAEPATPLLSADDARRRIAESGVDLTVDDDGIRAGALDLMIERKQEEMKRQMVLDNAPSSTVPIQIAASFAASAADPVNIASAFIPIYGEARYAALMARSTTRTARFAARARVGAIQGAGGAAIVEPIVLYASAQDQADYDMTDSLTNIAFGGVLGGGLHSVGGLVSDMRRKSLSDAVRQAADADAVAPVQQAAEAPASARLDAALRDDDPMIVLRDQFERAVEADRPRIIEEARGQAVDEMANTLADELEDLNAGRIPNVREVRREADSIAVQLERLDETFKVRAKAFQREGLSRKQAERAAREAIAAERQSLTARREELNAAVDGNRLAEQTRQDLIALRRGEVPDRVASRVDERAKQIADGFNLRGTARAVAESAPWQVRQSAMRAAIAQAVTGRPVDVEPVFAMADPRSQAETVQALKRPAQRPVDPDALEYSKQADQLVNSPDASELASAQKMLDDDMALTQEMAEQAGFDLNAYMREADELVADADTYAAAYRAAALCQLRN